jgi:hypothetical protein
MFSQPTPVEGRQMERQSTLTHLFVCHPQLVWELIAKPWLASVRDRMALARTCTRLYHLMQRVDGSLVFLRALYAVPRMLVEDRLRCIKRSGLLDCIQMVWERSYPVSAINNAQLMKDWISHAAAARNMGAVCWLLRKARFDLEDWPQLIPHTAEVLLAVDCGAEALAIAVNQGDCAWVPAALYAQRMQRVDLFMPVAICFMAAQQHDIFLRLLSDEHWPEKQMSASSRYAISLIAAICTQNIVAFRAWWQSESCKNMGMAAQLADGAPAPGRFLGGVLWLMLESRTPSTVGAARTMWLRLQEYIEL